MTRANSSDGHDGTGSARHDFAELDRAALFETHPVQTREFHSPTPPVCRAFDIMCHIIASGAPGCAFIAYPRFGKTWATEYCQRRLKEAFPKLPVILYVAHEEQRPTAARLYGELLQQSALAEVCAAPRPVPRQALARAWWVLAQDQGAKTIVLLGDEMQRLKPDEFTWLIDLTNDLHRMHVRVVSISFAQPELESHRNVFRQTRRGDILGRFMTRFIAFEGISSASELRSVMDTYDDPAEHEYPQGSGCSFTQFYLPRAYAKGWRLASCAGRCWEEFRKQAVANLNSTSKLQQLQVGMEWVAGTLQYALQHYGDLDGERFAISSEQWATAIESSGFPESLGLTYDPGWSRE